MFQKLKIIFLLINIALRFCPPAFGLIVEEKYHTSRNPEGPRRLIFSDTHQSQDFDISCDIYLKNGKLLAKLPFFRPLLTRNELHIPHPAGAEFGEPFLLEGPLVFVGYGITAEDKNWDDYLNNRIPGKIAVVMTGVPFNDTSRFIPSEWDASHKIDNAFKHGAIGVIFAGNPLRERLDNLSECSFLQLPETYKPKLPAIVMGTSLLESILLLSYNRPLRDYTSPPSVPETILTISEEENKPFGLLDLNITIKAHVDHNALKKTESEHYETYYYSGSLAERNINDLIQKHEQAYSDISKFCNLELNKKIIYISFPDWKMKWILTGHIGYGWAPGEFIMEVDDGNSFMDPWHETCHIFQNKLNPRYKGPMREGMATYWGGWMRKNVHILAKENLATSVKKLAPLSALLGDKNYKRKVEYRDWEYAENGSVNKYLIETYGIPKYLEFWKLLRTHDYDANIRALKTIYDKEAKDIELEWMEFLEKFKKE
jgi:hypothetical protein